MTYQSTTNQILEVISESTIIINDIYDANELIKTDNSKKQEIIEKFDKFHNEWYIKCKNILLDNELLLEHEDFINYPGSVGHFIGFDRKLNNILNFMRDRKKVLINVAKNIESKRNKEVILLNIDDFNNFK